MTKDAERSASVARCIRAVEKCCFANCQRAITRVPELASATYVEGFAVVVASRLPFEHAWIEADGVVIDPTLPDRDLAYFPGLRAGGRDALAAAKPNQKRRARHTWEPLFFQYGFGGFEHPGFVAARVEAERPTGTRVHAMRPRRLTPARGRRSACRSPVGAGTRDRSPCRPPQPFRSSNGEVGPETPACHREASGAAIRRAPPNSRTEERVVAHEIEVVGGEGRMLFVGQVPWHGLGQELTGNPTVAEAITAGGRGREVELVPLVTADESQAAPARAVRRVGDEQVLGVVGPGYHARRNRAAFQFFRPFLDAGLATLHTGRSRAGGRKVWLLARIEREPLVVGTDDEVRELARPSNSHDGTTRARVGFTPIRVVCANTLALATAARAAA